MQSPVLAGILQWSKTRPTWQRDALRRIVSAGDLNNADIEALAALCKAAHGLGTAPPAQVLEDKHLAITEANLGAGTLVSITHHAGVNALAPDQTITFSPSLTIVFGKNTAGKSGYTRILKHACRARAVERVLGNVLSGTAPIKGTATIRFRQSDKEESVAWSDDGGTSKSLAAVSVFDSHCAPVYLQDKNDVAFRPFGLDLFDRLASACAAVRQRLDAERSALNMSAAAMPTLPTGTKAHTLTETLTALTKENDVRALATLTEAEEARLAHLRNVQQDLQASNPKKQASSLTLGAERIALLATHVETLISRLGTAAIAELTEARQALNGAKPALQLLQEKVLTPGLLPGTGDKAWRDMWDAASRFSGVVYPGRPFPVVGDGARCPFCQQEIRPEAADRVRHFAEYVASRAQTEVRTAEATFSQALAKTTSIEPSRPDLEPATTELAEHDNAVAQALRDLLTEATTLRDQISTAAANGSSFPDVGLISGVAVKIRAIESALRTRAAQLGSGSTQMPALDLAELKELEARSTLRDQLAVVLGEIDRKKRLAAYSQALDDTTTHAITKKSTELTKQLVTEQLQTTFKSELAKLEFTHLAVEVQTAGGAKGALFHKIVFSNAPGVDVGDVLSEGESRALSLAAFLTELSTAPTKSAIIFDDPVSSLDHEWRERIAKRLVTEARDRQVIVFTHDLLFLRSLIDESERQDVICTHQYVRREGQAGITSSDLPWIAMNVNERLGVIKKRLQDATATYNKVGVDAYETQARDIYGLLREAWERAITEVLLNDVVQRYRHSIETKKVSPLHDITETDCDTVESAMSECSRWMRGHDAPAADTTPFPAPADLAKRVRKLEDWVSSIRTRRAKKK